MPQTDHEPGDRPGTIGVALRLLAGAGLGGLVAVGLGVGSIGGMAGGLLLGAGVGLGLTSLASIADGHRRLWGLRRQIHELETIDALTGLPNGRELRAWLDRHLPLANERQAHTALIVLHAEGIDRINESHGREVGDELLKAAVARIRTKLLDKDQLFRAGGTDLAVVRPELAGTHAAEELAESILELLGTPYEIEGELLRVPVCIGLAVVGGRPTSTDELLRDAEVATYRAIAAGGGAMVRFEQSLFQHLTPATAEQRLRTALERGDFQVAYLPVFSLTTGEVVEVEALLRWIDEGRGMVAADEFLSAMEQTGIIVPVGAWVIQEVCRQATYWSRTFPTHRPVKVTANLSRRQLLQADFVDTVAAALTGGETDPGRIILEINERSLSDQREDLWSVLRRCKDLGVALSLDDLGAANSSLATLRRLQLDQIKIDQSFARSVVASAEDTAVVRHITALAKDLGITTVAKAVVAEEQAAHLARLGVEHGLGHFFCEPVTPGQIDELIYGDLTRPPRPITTHQPEVTAPAPPTPRREGLPVRVPGEHAPSEPEERPERSQPVVVPDVGATRTFPRRRRMFA